MRALFVVACLLLFFVRVARCCVCGCVCSMLACVLVRVVFVVCLFAMFDVACLLMFRFVCVCSFCVMLFAFVFFLLMLFVLVCLCVTFGGFVKKCCLRFFALLYYSLFFVFLKAFFRWCL